MNYLDTTLADAPAALHEGPSGMDEDERTRFGINVRSARKARSLTQEQLAEVVGIKQGYLSRIEGGKADMTFEIMVRVARALETDVHKLLSP